MNTYSFPFHGTTLIARPSGTLWWPTESLLCVSDLHLGKADRIARGGGTMLPPYEAQDTLLRLEHELDATGARRVICLGDSFDDRTAADTLSDDLHLWLTRLIAGRDWMWIEGNHDPGPLDLPGSHRSSLTELGLIFRHIAQPGANGEVSGHYHPKARLSLRGTFVSRACFLIDHTRILMPAFGTYTGGLATTSPVLSNLMGPKALAILTGQSCHAIPMPRKPVARS